MARRASSARDENTAERLITAAVGAFGRLGYERARLEDIAAEAGITRPSLLHHFSSKDELYAATLRHAFLALEKALEQALMREGDYDKRLRHIVDGLIDFEREHLPMLALMLRGVLRGDDPIARAESQRSFVPLIDRLEAFVRFGAAQRLPARFPVRAAILQLILSHLMRSTLGDFGAELWKGDAHSWTLTRTLLAPTRE